LTHLDIKLSPSEQLNKSTIPVEDYRYLSPEQLAGLPMDQRSDIFSLGTLLFETTVGRPAFPGNSVAAVSQMVMEGAVVPSEDLPAQLNRLILRACAKERHGRFPDTLSLSEELLTQHWPDLSGDAGVAEYLSDSHRRRAG
jgi:serine/threonine protein kinase